MSVSETLTNKWRKIFHYRDGDDDGFITEKDVIGYSENFVTIYGDRALPAREIAKLLWDTFSSRGYQPKLTEQEMLDNYAFSYTHNLAAVRDKIERYCHLSFDAIDANGDGKISLEEYRVYQHSFNIHNRDYIELIFTQLDVDGDGAISREEFVKEIMDYVFQDAPAKIPELYDHDQAKHYRKK